MYVVLTVRFLVAVFETTFFRGEGQTLVHRQDYLLVVADRLALNAVRPVDVAAGGYVRVVVANRLHQVTDRVALGVQARGHLGYRVVELGVQVLVMILLQCRGVAPVEKGPN